mgnify:CR=1 FL=1
MNKLIQPFSAIFFALGLINVFGCMNNQPLNQKNKTHKQQIHQKENTKQEKLKDFLSIINNRELTENEVLVIVEKGEKVIPLLLDTLDYSSKIGVENASQVIKKIEKGAVPYLIEYLKERKTDSIGRGDLLYLTLLEWITNTSFNYQGESVFSQQKKIGIILSDEEKTKIVQQWIQWWKDNKSRSPIAWCIRDLLSENEKQREVAITKLKKMTNQTFDYDPKFLPKENGQSTTKWIHWWEVNKYKIMTIEERIMEILDRFNDEEFVDKEEAISDELIKFEDGAIPGILTWFEEHECYHRGQNLKTIGYNILFRYGKPVVPYAIEYLRDKRIYPSFKIVDDGWILTILSHITNKKFSYDAYQVKDNNGIIWSTILPPEEKQRLINKWQDWWEQNKEKKRIEWYLEDFKSSDLNTREGAIDKLKQIAGEDFGYAPKSSTEESINKWKNWWEENKALSEEDIFLRTKEKSAIEGARENLPDADS